MHHRYHHHHHLTFQIPSVASEFVNTSCSLLYTNIMRHSNVVSNVSLVMFAVSCNNIHTVVVCVTSTLSPDPLLMAGLLRLMNTEFYPPLWPCCVCHGYSSGAWVFTLLRLMVVSWTIDTTLILLLWVQRLLSTNLRGTRVHGHGKKTTQKDTQVAEHRLLFVTPLIYST